MVGIDTEKVLTTSSLGVPASTAASTLNLRSFEYGFMPGGYHIWIDTYGCRCQRLYLPWRRARLIGHIVHIVCRFRANSPKCLEVKFCELRLYGVLGSSL